MSSTQWVCWDCRRIVRRARMATKAPRCSQCGGGTVDVGMRLRLPPRDDERGWRALRAKRRLDESARSDERRVALVRSRHDLEKRIAALEARPPNAERERTVRVLRRHLARLGNP